MELHTLIQEAEVQEKAFHISNVGSSDLSIEPLGPPADLMWYLEGRLKKVRGDCQLGMRGPEELRRSNLASYSGARALSLNFYIALPFFPSDLPS